MKNDQGTEGDDGTTIVLSDVLERLEHLEARVELLESQVDERRVDEDMRGSRPTTSRDVAERRYCVVLRGRFDEDTNTFVSGVFDNLEDFMRHDIKGVNLLKYYLGMDKHVLREQTIMSDNLLRLTEKVESIRKKTERSE